MPSGIAINTVPLVRPTSPLVTRVRLAALMAVAPLPLASGSGVTLAA